MKKGRRIISLVVALALVAGLWYVVPSEAGKASAVTQAEIDAMEKKLDKVASQIKNLEKDIKEAASDKAQALSKARFTYLPSFCPPVSHWLNSTGNELRRESE